MTFPTPFDLGPMLGVTNPQYVEVLATQSGSPPVSGPCVIADFLLMFGSGTPPGWSETLTLQVVSPSVINGEVVPAGTVLHEIEVIYF